MNPANPVRGFTESLLSRSWLQCDSFIKRNFNFNLYTQLLLKHMTWLQHGCTPILTTENRFGFAMWICSTPLFAPFAAPRKNTYTLLYKFQKTTAEWKWIFFSYVKLADWPLYSGTKNESSVNACGLAFIAPLGSLPGEGTNSGPTHCTKKPTSFGSATPEV